MNTAKELLEEVYEAIELNSGSLLFTSAVQKDVSVHDWIHKGSATSVFFVGDNPVAVLPMHLQRMKNGVQSLTRRGASVAPRYFSLQKMDNWKFLI